MPSCPCSTSLAGTGRGQGNSHPMFCAYFWTFPGRIRHRVTGFVGSHASFVKTGSIPGLSQNWMLPELDFCNTILTWHFHSSPPLPFLYNPLPSPNIGISYLGGFILDRPATLLWTSCHASTAIMVHVGPHGQRRRLGITQLQHAARQRPPWSRKKKTVSKSDQVAEGRIYLVTFVFCPSSKEFECTEFFFPHLDNQCDRWGWGTVIGPWSSHKLHDIVEIWTHLIPILIQ